MRLSTTDHFLPPSATAFHHPTSYFSLFLQPVATRSCLNHFLNQATNLQLPCLHEIIVLIAAAITQLTVGIKSVPTDCHKLIALTSTRPRAPATRNQSANQRPHMVPVATHCIASLRGWIVRFQRTRADALRARVPLAAFLVSAPLLFTYCYY